MVPNDLDDTDPVDRSALSPVIGARKPAFDAGLLTLVPEIAVVWVALPKRIWPFEFNVNRSYVTPPIAKLNGRVTLEDGSSSR